jgi:2'-5' RNA ligase
MDPHSNGDVRINSFALVTYVPDPLGEFLDLMRRELEPGSNGPRAHVTLLPPRPILVTEEEVCREIAAANLSIPHFRIGFGEVRIFPTSHVIYLEVDQGCHELERIHLGLNHGALAFCAPWPYRPHLTVAQNLSRPQAEEIAACAAERWAAWNGPRSFLVEKVTFVQNTLSNQWLDLKEFHLPALVGVR